jgi:hypothetical protein
MAHDPLAVHNFYTFLLIVTANAICFPQNDAIHTAFTCCTSSKATLIRSPESLLISHLSHLQTSKSTNDANLPEAKKKKKKAQDFLSTGFPPSLPSAFPHGYVDDPPHPQCRRRIREAVSRIELLRRRIGHECDQGRSRGRPVFDFFHYALKDDVS